ncbi:putative wax ester synthase/diacylglycerol acyltransferase [Gordonia hirsuta DSM 44140 = NBRC 16056]|uniref:diacylglycerol O-acyltransferase n=2 Tax=Gordonia hirsuta TaxID=53427 RepID=L7LDT3_9ACTN|nr:putative wax ester synthase/diacylglycerol acyltransferase [Gordonia hirsuta DSM 44140 = NBRC 16056]
MGPVDAIWLHMDSPENLMVIDSLMVLDGSVDWDRVVGLLERELIERYRPFAQRVTAPRFRLGPPRWRDDPDFTLERQLVRHRLPDGDDDTLQRYVESQLVQPLPKDRPLWQAHLIDGYRHGAVLYSRIHHCMADGLALNQVMLSLTSATADGDLGTGEPAAGPATDARRGEFLPSAASVGRAVTAPIRWARRIPDLFSLQTAYGGVQAVTAALRQAERLGKITNKLFLADPPVGPLSGSPGVAKRAVWAEPFALADVKRLGRHTGTTVNDVLMATVAGALGTYVAGRDGRRRDLPTMVPVNVRPLDAPLPAELGNDFALVVVEYPSATEELLERIAQTHRRMEEIKNSAEVPIVFSTIWAIGQTTKEIERLLVDFFSSKAIGVTTNVPGPRGSRYLAGTRIRGTLAWVPTAGDQTLGISVFTYDGTVWVGFKADQRRVPDPEALVAAFDAEVKEMARLAQAV